MARKVRGFERVLDAPALFDGRPAYIVSNLPYNIGTALLVGWLSGPWSPWWASLTLMFQREVAERIVAADAWRATWTYGTSRRPLAKLVWTPRSARNRLKSSSPVSNSKASSSGLSEAALNPA